MIEYLVEFGKNHNLDTKVDKTGNVLITKPATKGMEDAPTVILQSHIDMVCDKLVDVDFDFHKDPIQTYIDGEWLTAKGTTLGADDGIGVAYELALLASDDIEHGKIECLFTVDEETGLTGAFGLEPNWMTGKYLINLDSEDEGQIFVSCAGGITTDNIFRYKPEEAPKGYFFMEASVKGFIGGHSGDDINKKRANAIKVLGRFLYMEKTSWTYALQNGIQGRWTMRYHAMARLYLQFQWQRKKLSRQTGISIQRVLKKNIMCPTHLRYGDWKAQMLVLLLKRK